MLLSRFQCGENDRAQESLRPEVVVVEAQGLASFLLDLQLLPETADSRLLYSGAMGEEPGGKGQERKALPGLSG